MIHVCPPAARAAAARFTPVSSTRHEFTNVKLPICVQLFFGDFRAKRRSGRNQTFGKRRGGRSDRGHLSGKPQTSQSAMLATATTPPGFPLVWEGVPTANYTMVGYDAGTLNIQVNA